MGVVAVMLALHVVRIVLAPPFVAAEQLAASWAWQPEEAVGLGVVLVLVARSIRVRGVGKHAPLD